MQQKKRRGLRSCKSITDMEMCRGWAYCRAPRRRCSKDEPEVKRQRRLLLLVMPCSQYRDGARTVARAAALPSVARRRRPRARGRGRSWPDRFPARPAVPGPRWDAPESRASAARGRGNGARSGPAGDVSRSRREPPAGNLSFPLSQDLSAPFFPFPLRHSNQWAACPFPASTPCIP